MTRKESLIIILVLNISICSGQTGGNHVYDFLNLTYSSLVSSLGGMNVSLRTNDLNIASQNPALLEKEMDRNLTLNYVNYFAGINYGMTMYSKSINGAGNFAAGLTYLNYGTFREADEAGTITGSFSASEYAFSVLYSRVIDTLFSVGINIKPVLSTLEKYTSLGFAVDIGGTYHSINNLFSAGFVIKNAGMQLTTYAGESREKLPFEIQAGASQKLAHAPFRFSLTLRHLEKFDLTYNYVNNSNPGYTTTTGTKSNSGFFENAMRHAIVGVELIPGKNFYVSAGYNYQRRKELQIDTRTSAVGFSWGFGINTSFMTVGFGRATYHLAGASNNISIMIRPDLLYKKFHK
jgi:hypothetical protein